MLIELVCITAFVARVFHGSLFAPDRWKYLRDRKNVTIIVLVVVSVSTRKKFDSYLLLVFTMF